MKIEHGQCKCGAIVYLADEAGVSWSTDTEPLDAQAAVAALLAGRQLYRVREVGPTYRSLSGARPEVLAALQGEPGERPIVVAEHGCPPGAAVRLGKDSNVQTVQPTPHGPSAGRTAPSSGPSAATSSVPVAANQASDPSKPQPRCSNCGKPCQDGTYASIELGDILQWAAHVSAC